MWLDFYWPFPNLLKLFAQGLKSTLASKPEPIQSRRAQEAGTPRENQEDFRTCISGISGGYRKRTYVAIYSTFYRVGITEIISVSFN